MTPTARARGVAPLWLALAATLAGLGLAYLLKAPCTARPWIEDFQYKRLCYNDLQPLFHHRGLVDGLVPYEDTPEFEYPVLTGTFMWGAAELLDALTSPEGFTDNAYFNLSAVLLAPFAIATTLLLRPRVPAGRLMLWAFGSPMILYAFHNWDLLAVAAAVAGLVLVEINRPARGALALGVGASAKLFPAFVLPAMLAARAAARDLRGAARSAAAFGAAALAVNVPWMIAAWDSWLDVWRFHARRYPDFGTAWYWIAHHGRARFPSQWWDPGQEGYRDLAGRLGFVLLAALALWALRRGWIRARTEGSYPVVAVSLALVAAFLLVSKVHSPQYALWVVPFLVLLDVPWRLVALYLAADLAVYVSGFYWFTVMSSPQPGWRVVFEWSVLVRAAALGVLYWWAVARARRVVPEGRAPATAPAGGG